MGKKSKSINKFAYPEAHEHAQHMKSVMKDGTLILDVLLSMPNKTCSWRVSETQTIRRGQ